MRIHVTDKQLISKRVVVWQFEKNWNWSDFLCAVDTTLETITWDTDISDVVLDIRHSLPDEHLTIPNFCHMIKKLTNCKFFVVTSGADLMTNVITTVMQNQVDDCDGHLRLVHTIDDAFRYIEPTMVVPLPKTTVPHTDQTCHCLGIH